MAAETAMASPGSSASSPPASPTGRTVPEGNGAAANANGNGVTPMNDVSSTTANGRSRQETPQEHLDRSQIVRIVAQAVRSLGFNDAASLLERDSGVEAMSAPMRKLRDVVLRGRWDELEDALSGVSVFRSAEDARAARFVLYEQKFLELLELGHTAAALACLRGQLTDCAPGHKALHRLPMLHMCQTPAELRRRAQWPGAGTQSRMRVLDRLRKYIPADQLFQEHRLEALLRQSVAFQKTDARWPYTVQDESGLLEDLVHDPERLPKRPVHRLDVHDDEVWFVQFSNNGRYLASGSKDRSVIVWEVARVYDGNLRASEAIRFRFDDHEKHVSFLAWSPDDTRLLSASWKTISMWDVTSGTEVRSFRKHEDQIVACVWAPDGNSFFSGASDKELFRWDAATGETLWTHRTDHSIMDLALSTDGKRLVCIDSDRTITVFDAEKHTKIRSMKEAMWLTSCTLSADNVSLLVNTTSNSQDQSKIVGESEMHVWNIESGRLERKFLGYEQVQFVIRGCFGGYGEQFVLCGSENKLVHVWDRATGDLMLRLEGHNKTVNSVAWSPTDPQLFASGSDDGTIIVRVFVFRSWLFFLCRVLTVCVLLFAVCRCGAWSQRLENDCRMRCQSLCKVTL